MKLYSIDTRGGHPGSHNALKVSILLNELGITPEVIELDPETELQPAQSGYRHLNPNGLTPTIDDDGFVLWESSAILQYLCDSYGGQRLLPRAGQQRALMLQWLGWEASTLTPSLMAFFLASSNPESTEVAAEARSRLLTNLELLNRQLMSQDYVAGDYSIADIALGCNVVAAFMLQLDLSGYSGLLAWLERLRLRTAWQELLFLRDIGLGVEQGQLLAE